MLRKLIKYDLKNMYQGLWLFYMIALLFSGISRICNELEIESSIWTFIIVTLNIITYLLIFGVLIITFVRILSRFVNNLYKDESYLTYTLPVNKKSIYLSKFISGNITVATSVIVICTSLFVLLYSNPNIEYLKSTLQAATVIQDSTMLGILFKVIIILLMQAIIILTMLFTAIVIGFRAADSKVTKTACWGIIFYMLNQVVNALFMFIIGLFVPSILESINTNILDVAALNYLLYFEMLVYVATISIYYFVGNKIFLKGVNVD